MTLDSDQAISDGGENYDPDARAAAGADIFVSIVLVVVVSAPLSLVIESPLVGALGGIGLLIVVNAVYWRVRGERLRDVYPVVGEVMDRV